MTIAREIFRPDILTSLGAKHGVKGLEAFFLRWSHQHVYGLAASNMTEHTHLPLYETVKQSYQMRTDPLWWHLSISKKNGGDKKVVRSWLIRRCRNAFIKALQTNGYHRNGVRLPLAVSAHSDLCGTVVLGITVEAHRMSWKDLCEDANKAVKAIEKNQKRMHTP